MGKPRRYPDVTRRTVEALLWDSPHTMSDIARQTGIPVRTVCRWNREMRVRARAPAQAGAPGLAALDAALRAHLARQIAALAHGLLLPEPTVDSGRVLRDLAGMKRLLDDLTDRADGVRREARTNTQGPDPGAVPPVRIDLDGAADGLVPGDIASLRADLARRYAAFAQAAGPAGAGPAESGAPALPR